MLADFFTKPLQGSLFRKLRDALLGYKNVRELHSDDSLAEPDSNQERVSSQNMSSNSEPNKDFESGTQVDHGTKFHLNHDGIRNKVTWADIVIGTSNKK